MRLLVVEDEVRLAQALQRGLQAEGFAVDLAGDGPTGLDLARHGDYDALILDIMLPGLSGYRLVQALRNERIWVPVLMLSAKDGEYDQADGLDCRRRRLPDQAVLLRGAAGPAPGPAAAGGAGTPGGADRRRDHAGPGRPEGHPRRRRRWS